MHTRTVFAICVGLTLCAQPPALPAPSLDPALEKLSALVGGTWVNVPADPQKPFVIEFRYEMALGGRAVRGVGVIGKGTQAETRTEALMGWDPVKKSVYYFDFHGDQTVYRGTIRAVGDVLETEFETVVGDPGQFRARDEFPDKDTLISTILGRKEGQWVELHKIRMKRRR
jgi:hypothetical protein